jgi:hypothetical protein
MLPVLLPVAGGDCCKRRAEMRRRRRHPLLLPAAGWCCCKLLQVADGVSAGSNATGAMQRCYLQEAAVMLAGVLVLRSKLPAMSSSHGKGKVVALYVVLSKGK